MDEAGTEARASERSKGTIKPNNPQSEQLVDNPCHTVACDVRHTSVSIFQESTLAVDVFTQ